MRTSPWFVLAMCTGYELQMRALIQLWPDMVNGQMEGWIDSREELQTDSRSPMAMAQLSLLQS